MIKKVLLRTTVALTSAFALVGVAPAAAFAQPANDDFAGATTINSLPFDTTQDTSAATADPTDPQGCHRNPSVWFAFTPATDMLVQASTAGSEYSTVLSAWTGTQGSLTQRACNYDYYDDEVEGPNSRITFAATAGTTYYFLVVAYFDDEVGNLQLSVKEVDAPGNDNFTDATAIDGIPFSYQGDLGAASMEAGEPTSSCGPMKKTVWYSYTPTVTESVTVAMNYWGGVVAYTGTSLTGLTPIGCSSRLTFRAQAGTTYHFQVTESRCCTAEPSAGPVAFELDVAPAPVADFSSRPTDPSVFDTVTFSNLSSDPARTGPTTALWDFGDGTTSTVQSPSHQYAADGDYTVRLTVTTTDGRTATKTRVVAVRTHDVAVTRVAVPALARVGQTIAVRVWVRNTRLPETVRVDLNRSAPGGFSQVGSLTKAVPATQYGRTLFLFSYQVTADDLAAGEITFRADATTIGTRDAAPADNTLLSSAVDIF